MNFKVDISVCRVCMKSESGISLFKHPGLLEKFVYTTKHKVKEDDSLPSILCKKCVARLSVAYEFCRLANTSEKHLRNFLSKINYDFQEVTKGIPQEDEDGFVDETDGDNNVHTLIAEAGGFDQYDDQATSSKDATMDVTEELEVVEVRDDIVTKTEVFDHEIYMEEFHEIIQEDNAEPQMYLDENSTEELQLYEDGNDLLEDEERVEEENVQLTDQDFLSENEIKEEKYSTKKTNKRPTKKGPIRKSRKISGESPAVKLEGKSNICIKCNKDFSTKTNLMRHMSTHDGVRPYQCNVCGKGFTQNGSLKQHMFIHTGERPHVCPVCQRGFTQSKSLIFHMRRHTGEKPFTCEQCGINFRQKDGLKHHVQKYHSGEQSTPERHTCCICARVLSSKYSLGVHMKKHVNKKERVYDKKTNIDIDSEVTLIIRKDELKGDSLQPESEPEQETHILSSTPPPQSSEEQQTSTHTSILRTKQFQCGKCYKSFHIKRNLLRHLRNHDVSTLQLHECGDCKIGFDTKRSLKLHRQREHHDVVDDLNSCEYCNAPFATLSDLSEHITSVHDAIEQDCPHCNAHFKSQKLYYDHLLEHEHMLED